MTVTKSKQTAKKKPALRHNEYYNMQQTLDGLYEKSLQNGIFQKLMTIILSEQNILEAYRNIKRNKGSRTAGVNGHTMAHWENKSSDELVQYVRRRLENYVPQPVRRVEIPKESDPTKVRPLGIPTIEERIIQQAIKQVLEPICEAKFYKHSYGFRPNRSTLHALERANDLMILYKLHYVVNIDIKGFFDNVDHGKLLKQLWSIGIRDKQLICIISKMLKAPVAEIGVPEKGTPQGGILSPLLANVVLNELDWWIYSQWEGFPTEHDYTRTAVYYGKPYITNGNKNVALKKSKLKEMYIVRYADDFKIFCRTFDQAIKIKIAVEKWLKERLHLEVNQEKSTITNLKQEYTDFLGFKFKTQMEKGKYKTISHIGEKAQKKIYKTLKNEVRRLQKDPSGKQVMKFNSVILGMHNYYSYATRVYKDLNVMAYHLNLAIYNRLKRYGKRVKRKRAQKLPTIFTRYYKSFKGKIWLISGQYLFPINGTKWKQVNAFNQKICNYTEQGRELIHNKLQLATDRISIYLLKHPVENKSVEYNDNRISKYFAQQGKCGITRTEFDVDNIDCHHITPVKSGGTDKYENLILVTTDAHKLIHSTNPLLIQELLKELKLNKKKLVKLNKLRAAVGLDNIGSIAGKTKNGDSESISKNLIGGKPCERKLSCTV